MPISGYVLELAKSGRATCKGCKEKIAKGALRIGTESDNGEYTMCSWRHACAACFKIPKKKYGKSLDAFVEGEFQNADEELVKQFKISFETSAAEIDKHDTGLKRRFDEISTALASYNNGCESTSSTKKSKKNNDKSAPASSLSQDVIKKVAEEKGMPPKLVEAIGLYGSGMTTADLKQILKWNYLLQSGKKDELVARVIDGHVFGTIPRCPECHGGEDDPERSESGRRTTTLTCIPSGKGDGQGKWSCKGYHNGSYRVSCNFTSNYVKRGEVPWVRTVEEYEQVIREQAAAQKIKDSKGLENVEFDTSNMDERSILDSILAKARDAGIILPSNDGDARITLAGLYNANNRKITETLVAAKKQYGTHQEAKEKAASAMAACKCPENAKLAGYFLEASTHAESFKKAAYKKVQFAIQNLDFVFGSEGTPTGKQMGSSKKHKVDGIGKSSGLKMDEYLQDGKIQAFVDNYGMSFSDDDNNHNNDDTSNGNDSGMMAESSSYGGYGSGEYGGSGGYNGSGGYGDGYNM